MSTPLLTRQSFLKRGLAALCALPVLCAVGAHANLPKHPPVTFKPLEWQWEIQADPLGRTKGAFLAWTHPTYSPQLIAAVSRDSRERGWIVRWASCNQLKRRRGQVGIDPWFLTAEEAKQYAQEEWHRYLGAFVVSS